MNMSIFDWSIVAALLIFLTGIALVTKVYVRSVSDFLAANRCAGRYVLTIAEGMGAYGVLATIATFEMYYTSGYSAFWWQMLSLPIFILISVSGWIIYRFRQTRSLTMAQFFEMRYSKKFRIFSGMLAVAAGVVNFGIYPAAAARFFIYLCGLPENIQIAGAVIPTFLLVMIILTGIALFLTIAGGQITVIITDFSQGLFCNIVFAVILVVIMFSFSWSHIADGLLAAPAEASLVNPFHTSQAKDFNLYYFVIIGFSMFYQYMAWQGSQAYNASAKNPHEARMAKALSGFRDIAMGGTIIVVPIFVYAVMHNPHFSEIAGSINSTLAALAEPQLRTQVTVPTALGLLLPKGIVGAFCAAMLAAHLSSTEAMLHSWGSIFIQDVVLPLHKKPLDAGQHLLVLRLAIVGVAAFTVIFSLLFQQTTYLAYFGVVTISIFTAGAGAVLIGGLYWKRGTSHGAWVSLAVGAVISAAGFIIRNKVPSFPINEVSVYFIACICASACYVLVSLLYKPRIFDITKLLHRGDHLVEDDFIQHDEIKINWFYRKLGINKEFTRGDKISYIFIIGWYSFWALFFIVFSFVNILFEIPTAVWCAFWKFNNWNFLVMGIVSTVWFTIGGIRDAKNMLHNLRLKRRDDSDDGTVYSQNNIGGAKVVSDSKT